jgi:glycine/D-amino acid oxidase-like deaminating enzyme
MALDESLPMHADVVIVGGGIVGCSAAYYLAKRGVSVVLLEKDEIGRAQSGRNWGFIRQQGRDPLELPLMIEANRIWSGIERELGTDVEWVQAGNLALAANVERIALFDDWGKMARDRGLDTKVLSATELKALIPDLQGDWLGGMYTRSDGHAEPRKATQAFCTGAVKHGARVVEHCTVEAIETTNDAVTGVTIEKQIPRSARNDRVAGASATIARNDKVAGAFATIARNDKVGATSGTIRAKTVIAAAGAWTAQLLRPLGLSLPQRWVRSTVARTTPVRPITDIGVWAPTVAFRQRRDGTLNLGGGGWADHDLTLDSVRHARLFMPNYLKNRKLFRFHVGKPFVADALARIPGLRGHRDPFGAAWALEPAPNRSKATFTLDRFRRLFPSIGDVAITEMWAGYIDATPDAVPVIGAVDRPRGVVIATGFSGHGFGLGPAAGRVVAELVTDGKASLDIRGFRFSRFAEGDIGEPRAVL